MGTSYYTNDKQQEIAYVHTEASQSGEDMPAVMFLGGFKSDMAGTKAIHLEEQCKARGQEFVRFDYSGHGESDGAFIDGTISSWKQDAMDILDHVVQRDVVLVGSSMGGWIALLLLLERSDRVKAVIGIAAAPDFTTWIEEKLGDKEREMIEKLGRLEVPNDYSDDPYIFTKALLEDGREQSLLNKDHAINVPLTLIQGKKDDDVPWETANQIESRFKGPDTRVIFVENGDHRLSTDADLDLIDEQVLKMSTL